MIGIVDVKLLNLGIVFYQHGMLLTVKWMRAVMKAKWMRAVTAR